MQGAGGLRDVFADGDVVEAGIRAHVVEAVADGFEHAGGGLAGRRGQGDERRRVAVFDRGFDQHAQQADDGVGLARAGAAGDDGEVVAQRGEGGDGLPVGGVRVGFVRCE